MGRRVHRMCGGVCGGGVCGYAEGCAEGWSGRAAAHRGWTPSRAQESRSRKLSRSRVVIAYASSTGRRRRRRARRRAPRASLAHQSVPLCNAHTPVLMHHPEELRPAPARSDPAAPIAFVDRAPRTARRCPQSTSAASRSSSGWPCVRFTPATPVEIGRKGSTSLFCASKG